MANLIYDWLNEEVKLSRHITSLGDDFKDGYLLGELLAKYNQQADFDHFSAKGNPDAKISNFCRIEPTMRQVGVPFNSKIASEIMNASDSSVKNLLYELKTALEAITRNSMQSTGHVTGGYNDGKILRVVAPSRPLYDKTMALTFENAIRTMMDNPNEVLMEHATRRFRERKNEFRQTISAGHTGMMDGIQDELYRNKEIARNRRAHEGEFAEAWEAINVSQWKTNQRVAHERRELKKRVEFSLTQKREAKRATGVMRTRDNTFSSIDEFDSRLETAILSSSSGAAGGADDTLSASRTINHPSSLIKTIRQPPRTGGGPTPELVYIDQTVLKEGLVGAQKKMKEHHEDSTARQQTHDRRRRRFLREFDTAQTRLSQGFFEKDVVAQLLNNSHSEVAENCEMERAVSYKQIMVENRANREELIRAKAQADARRNAEWQATQVRRELDWVIRADLRSQLARRQALLEAASSADRCLSEAVARETVGRILDLAEWVIACRTLGAYNYEIRHVAPQAIGGDEEASTEVDQPSSSSVVPDIIWRDAAMMFTSPLGVAQSLPVPRNVDATLALQPFSISERPLCSDPQWLFQRAFDSQQAMAPQPPVAGVADDTSRNGNHDNASSGAIVQHLACEDSAEFVHSVNEADIPSGESDPSTSAADAADVAEVESDKDLVLTPSWVLAGTAPKHFLGEAVIAIRCAEEPVPEEPAPVVDTAHIPLRAAICGVSDVARRAFAEELRAQVPGLTVIKTETLVRQALQFQADIDSGLVYVAAEQPETDSQSPAVESAADVLSQVVVEEAAEPPNVEMEHAQSLADASEELEAPATSSAEVPVTSSAEVSTEDVVERSPEPPAPSYPAWMAEDEPAVDETRVRFAAMAALSQQVSDCLLSGRAVPDELYVALVVHEVQGISTLNNGFALEDFPNTKQQALLLMEALSGTRYDLRKPQAADRASVFTPHSPCEEVLYDIRKCGLDAIVYVDGGDGAGPDCSGESDMAAALEERVRARRNLFTGEVEQVADDCASVAGLQEVFAPARPYHTSGLDLTVAQQSNRELRDLFQRFNVLDTLSVKAFPTLSEAVRSKVAELRERFIPKGNLEPGYLAGGNQTEAAPAAEEEAEPEGPAETEDDLSPEELAALEAEALLAQEQANLALIRPRPPPVREVNSVPRKLAQCLSRMWALSEEQSRAQSARFFTAFRDLRYQFVQRRRCAVDSLNHMLMRHDRRQELFDAFRAQFNAMEAHMRFDPDCAAELHLQALELGDAICRECEARRRAALDYVNKQMLADGVVALAVHRCNAEAAALAQSEFNRFYVALHLLFDFTKAVKGFERQSRVVNGLEVMLPVVLPSLDAAAAPTGKGKEAKKEKEPPKKKGDTSKAAPVPFREPIPAVLLSMSSVSTVPEPKPADAPVDPKANKKPKDKKGAEDAAVANPFSEVEARIAEEVGAKWGRAVFAASRDVYECDESVCAALERAVWFEADKLLQSVAQIRAHLAQQAGWLESTESNLAAVLADMVEQRFHRELAAGQQLVSLAAEAIAAADPIEELWLATPDAMPPVNPRTAWRRLHDHLPEQHRLRIPQEICTACCSVGEEGTGASAERPRSVPNGNSCAVASSNEAQHVSSRSAVHQALDARRAQRECAFLEMGMSPSSARLAARNETLLEEQLLLSQELHS